VTERQGRWAPAPWLLLGLVAGLAVLSTWLGLNRPPGAMPYDLGTVVFEAIFICPAPVGAFIVSRRPGHPIGWLMLAISLVGLTGGVLAETARHFYDRAPDLGAAIFIASDTLFKIVFLLLGVLLLLFPTGRLPSRRWRWPLGVGIVALACAAALEFVSPGPLADYALSAPPPNPFGIAGLGAGARFLGLAAFVGFFGFLMLAAASVALRFGRADSEQRLQLKWFSLAGIIFVASLVAGNIFPLVAEGGRGWAPVPLEIVELASAAGMAVAIAIAILKHRLFDIEVVISRTVAYGGLAAVITLAYIAVVAGAGSLLAAGSASRLLLAVVVTAAVAAAFQPVRARLERLADRLVYGRRAAPYEVLAEFTSRLDGSQSSLELMPIMATMLAQGTGCDAATVWLRENGGEVPASSFPEGHLVDPDAATRCVFVQHSGNRLGRLAVARRSGQALSPTEERLMDGLALQAGLVLHNVGLQEELRRRLVELRQSRHRLVAAQDEARRRLERDLHDGAQQQLISLRMKLGLASTMARRKPAELEPLLEEMQGELGEALDSLRNLARGVYPPLLEAEGLRAALRARARQVPLAVDVNCGDERYPREMEGAVYFCCSEALQNVAKHSRARSGSVRVWREDGQLRFEVRDDGRGLKAAASKPGGGLQNLRDRLDVLGGGIEVSSTPGAGVSVIGWLPLTSG
jgi:signal transduction histidine kinase